MKNKSEKFISNSEFVDDIMNFSRHGVLSQVFVIEAIRYYCEHITKHDKPADEPNSMISPIAWYNLAHEIQEKLIEKYETNSGVSR
jgi:hypothetical protein